MGVLTHVTYNRIIITRLKILTNNGHKAKCMEPALLTTKESWRIFYEEK